MGHRHCRTPWVNYIEKYGHRLITLHVHDNNGAEDEHLLPFDGTVNWREEASLIAKSAYRGSLTLESAPLAGLYEHTLMESARRADRLVELMGECVIQ